MATGQASGTTTASPQLIEEFELAFQNCFSALTNQEHFNTTDADEVKTGVEQSIQKFLDVAKEIETYFLQKRLLLATHKPEQVLKEDINELKTELARKETLIQKHYDKLQHWHGMLSRIQGPQPQTGQTSPAPGQGHPTIPQQGPVPGSGQPPPVSQPIPPQQQPHFPQGPLAYLEQTTSNIGLPERR